MASISSTAAGYRIDRSTAADAQKRIAAAG
jgi:hypothetical protein